MTDPNFPVNLNINPSVPLPLTSSSSESIKHENFGSEAQAEAIKQYGIAGRVWEAAYLILQFVKPSSQMEFDVPSLRDDLLSRNHATILELGSGSGLIASAIIPLLNPGHHRMIVTDLPEVCKLLEKNLQQSSIINDPHLDQEIVQIRPLSWGNECDARALATSHFTTDRVGYVGHLTHIICSDLVYFSELLAPLLRTLLRITAGPFVCEEVAHRPVIYISYKIRSLVKETAFWSAFGLWFDFRPILYRQRMGDEKSDWERFGQGLDDSAFLFIAARRLDSLSWIVPDSDDDLLGGVGAHSTTAREVDDTFENLLFMSLG